MAYAKQTWTARVGTFLNRFTKSNETSTSVELTNNPGTISVAGTPFSVARMQHIEDGLEAAAAVADAALPSTSYTAADVLSKLLTVDGDGSGLDADMVAGSGIGVYGGPVSASNVNIDTILKGGMYRIASGGSVVNRPSGASTTAGARLLVVGALTTATTQIYFDTGTNRAWLRSTSVGFANDAWVELWTSGSLTPADILAKLLTVDGTGSGLDADLLDGLSSGSFLRSDSDSSDGNQSSSSYSVPATAIGQYRKHRNTNAGTQTVTLPTGELFIYAINTSADAASTGGAVGGGGTVNLNTNQYFRIFRVR